MAKIKENLALLNMLSLFNFHFTFDEHERENIAWQLLYMFFWPACVCEHHTFYIFQVRGISICVVFIWRPLCVVVYENSDEKFSRWSRCVSLRMFASIAFPFECVCVCRTARPCQCESENEDEKSKKEKETRNGSIEWKFLLSWPSQATYTHSQWKNVRTHTCAHHILVVRSLHGLIFEREYEENPPYSFRIFLFANVNANAHDTEKKTTTRELRKRDANEGKSAKKPGDVMKPNRNNERQKRIANQSDS